MRSRPIECPALPGQHVRSRRFATNRIVIRCLAAASMVFALATPGAASASPALPIGHAARWLTDAQGRVVIVHGTNMVNKLPPYYPAAIGFGEDDAAFLQSIGFNAVRVGVIWKAVEPEPGVYDNGYVEQIAETVQTLASHGIVSLLDFHQDLYNELFEGEGAPDWAVQDGGLPNPSLGFPGNYFGNPAMQKSFDNFWANSAGPGGVGLLDRFAAAWKHVAARFAGDSSVLGYELFNEPFPGTKWQKCEFGCPEFDAKLTAFNRQVAAAIRSADPSTLIFYEPNVLFNSGLTTSVGALEDPHAGFAFHDYCLATFGKEPPPNGCSTEKVAFSNALKHVAQTREALLLTEFGATTAEGDLNGMVALADHEQVPWLEWDYRSMVLDPSQPPTGSNLGQPALRTLVEPYPQAIAGTPRAWAFDRSTNTFTLKYSTERAGGGTRFPPGSATEIATPPLVYPHGYAASVKGGTIVSSPNAGVLDLAAKPGVHSVSLTVTPGS
jgi:endoglycosylceramidase